MKTDRLLTPKQARAHWTLLKRRVSHMKFAVDVATGATKNRTPAPTKPI